MKCHRLFLVLSLFFFFTHSYAEEVDSVRNNVLTEEVIVHSFKQNRDLRVAPLSVSVVNGTAIRNRQITGIKEFSATIPNLFMPDYGSKLTSPVYIRGIGSRINAPSVGLYVDGVPFFEKSAFDFDLNDIDRIEVLRGPQGTLYGRNTMGGIIHIYTRSPFRYKGTTVRASLGNYNNRDFSFSNYSKPHESLGMALSGNYTHQGGYFTNRYSGKKADRMDAGSVRGRLEWKPTELLYAQLQSSLDYSDQGGYPYAPLDSASGKPLPVDYNSFSSYKRLISTTGLTFEYTAPSFRLHSQASFQYLSDKQGIDQDFTPQDLYFARQEQKQRMMALELNMKSLPQLYNWLFGAFVFRQDIDNEVILEYRAQQFETQKLYDNPTYGIALFHQSVFDRLFTDGLSLTLGLRYDYEKASSDYEAYRLASANREQTDYHISRLDFQQLTPKAALEYTMPSGLLFYATVTRGYKTGGFNNSFEEDEDRTFKPEYSWNYETGAKFQAWGKRIRADLCFFYIDWKNQQVYQPLPSGRGTMLKNAGRSSSKGIEASLWINPLNGLLLHANYGYTYAVFEEYMRDETTDYKGNHLPMVPRQTLSASADYTISSPGLSLDRLTFSLSYTGTGKLYWNENNLTAQSWYGLLNGKVTAAWNHVTFALWGKNLTGEEYLAFCFESMGERYAQKGKPFTFGADLAFHF